MRIYWSLCIFLCSFFLQAQDSYQPEKIYSPAELLEDFDILTQTLETAHPGFYEFTPKEAFDAYIKKARAGITEGMTEDQFHVVVRKLVKEIGCGHTTAVPSKEWYTRQSKDNKGIPLSVYVLNDAVYIKYYQEDSLNLHMGHEIVSINNRKSSDILRQMREIQQGDGYTQSYVNAAVSRFFSVYHLFLFGRSDTYNLTYKDSQGNEGNIVLQGGAKSLAPIDSKKAAFEGDGMGLFYDELHSDLAILDINSFSSSDFKKNYKHIFQELENKQIEHLIIDLRDNHGGFFPNGNRLLRYLLPNKFSMKFSRPKGKLKKNPNMQMSTSNKLTKVLFKIMPDRDKVDPDRNNNIRYKPMKKYHFNGKIYVLTNGGTFSMGSLVTTRLKHDRNATIIGTETGGGEFGSYAIINNLLDLPNTKVRVVIPYFFLDHDITPEKKGRGVIPDILVEQTIEDIIVGKDKELEIVRSLIK